MLILVRRGVLSVMKALACKEEAFKREKKKVWLKGSNEPVLRIKK